MLCGSHSQNDDTPHGKMGKNFLTTTTTTSPGARVHGDCDTQELKDFFTYYRTTVLSHLPSFRLKFPQVVANYDMSLVLKHKGGEFSMEQTINSIGPVQNRVFQMKRSVFDGNSPIERQQYPNAASNLSHFSDLPLTAEPLNLHVKNSTKEFVSEVEENTDNEQERQSTTNFATSTLPPVRVLPSRANVIVRKETNTVESPPISEKSVDLQNLPGGSLREHTVNTNPISLRPQSHLSDNFFHTVSISEPSPPTTSPVNSYASMVSTPDLLQDDGQYLYLPWNISIKIKDGHEVLTPHALFSLKLSPMPIEFPSSSSFNGFVSNPNPSGLLKGLVSGKFHTEPAKWLQGNQFVSRNQICACAFPMQLISEKSGSLNFQWKCSSCDNIQPFTRPAFFSKFPNIPLQTLLVMTYHWAVMSDLKNIFQDVSIPLQEVMKVWNGFRAFCLEKISRPVSIVQSENIDEIIVVQFGAFYVMAVMDVKSKFTRLKVVPIGVCPNLRKQIFRNTIASWSRTDEIARHVLRILNKLIDDDSHYEENNSQRITHYLKNRLSQIFGSYDISALKVEDFQALLDELQWRERWGHNGQKAFMNMIHFTFGKIYERPSPLPHDHPFNLPETFCTMDFDSAMETDDLPNGTSRPRLCLKEEIDPIDDTQYSNPVPSTSTSSSSTCPVAFKHCKSESEDEDDESLMDTFDTVNTEVGRFDDIPTVKEGNTEISSQVLLEIRTWPLPDFPDTSLDPRNAEEYASQYKLLKVDLESNNMFNCPAKWIITKSNDFTNNNKCCPKCGAKVILRPSQSIDEFVYNCSNGCSDWQEKFIRPDLFSIFGLPLRNIMTLLFHWAVQSDFKTLKDSVSNQLEPGILMGASHTVLSAMDTDAVWEFYKTLQTNIRPVISCSRFYLGSNGNVVQANIIKFGVFYILCALEVKEERKMFRFRAFPIVAGWNEKIFVKELESWILPKTILITPFKESYFRKKEIIHYTANPNSDFNIDDVTNFSKSLISFLFGRLCTALLPIEILQNFLNEVQWRHFCAQTLSTAFYGMLIHLNKLHKRDPQGKTILINKNVSDPNPKDTVPAQPSTSEDRRPSNRSENLPSENRNFNGDSTSELHYYCRRALHKVLPYHTSFSNSLIFKCCQCSQNVLGNYNTMNHIHLHYQKEKERLLRCESLQKCTNCTMEFRCLNEYAEHTDAVHTNFVNCCLMCCKSFPTKKTLMEHLHQYHMQYEMPYGCQVMSCNFRSSLYVDLLDHFLNEHHDTQYLLCFFCMNAFEPAINACGYQDTEIFANHLREHYNRRSKNNHCQACCLIFVSENDLAAHKLRDHISFVNESDLAPFQTKERLYKFKPTVNFNSQSSNKQQTGNSSCGRSMICYDFAPQTKTLPATVLEKETMCFECRTTVELKHFERKCKCLCGFSTYCSEKFSIHEKCCSFDRRLRRKAPYSLNFTVKCSCGFSCHDGIKMAEHAGKCDYMCHILKDSTSSSSKTVT